MKTVSSLFLVMVKDPLRDLRLSIPHLSSANLVSSNAFVNCLSLCSSLLYPYCPKNLSALSCSLRVPVNPCLISLGSIPALFLFFRAPFSFLVAHTHSFFGSFCFTLSTTHIHKSVMELEFSSCIFAPAPCRFSSFNSFLLL
jgi:hypothetical protein